MKDVGYVRRTLAEAVMPFAMMRNLRKSPLSGVRWDGVIWYAPSIFHGPLAARLKRESGCKGYLVIRDIFPEWAVDMGLLRRGAAYQFFSMVARYQYSVADIIGVQTAGNKDYFADWQKTPGRVLEVLQNWLGEPARRSSSIQLGTTSLAGRKILVYAGNMGIAQGLDIIVELADRMKERKDVGFVFVGRGSHAVRLRQIAQSRGLENVLFFDEIDPDEIPDLYRQCSVGLVSLDARHKSHNIPGKFLTYMQSGLPVLANVNAGNDLAGIIRTERVGQVCETSQLAELEQRATVLLEQADTDKTLPPRCTALFAREYSVVSTVGQRVQALSRDHPP